MPHQRILFYLHSGEKIIKLVRSEAFSGLRRTDEMPAENKLNWNTEQWNKSRDQMPAQEENKLNWNKEQWKKSGEIKCLHNKEIN